MDPDRFAILLESERRALLALTNTLLVFTVVTRSKRAAAIADIALQIRSAVEAASMGDLRREGGEWRARLGQLGELVPVCGVA